MIRIGVANYGLDCWYGNLYDHQDRFDMLKEIGYDGLEKLNANTPEEAVTFSALARRQGLGFGYCAASTAYDTIRFTAALGLDYVWTDPKPLGQSFDDYCRKVNSQIESASKYGLKVGVHNHLGLIVETEEQLNEFLEKCPKAGIIFDTAHMVGAGGDPLRVVENHFDRLITVHLKDFVYKDKNADVWYNRLRFCELGAGEMGDLNLDILKLLLKKGYDNKWIFVEQDTHLQDPRIDLKTSRDFIRRAGI